METEFYYCPVCGNVIVKLVDSGVTPHCCGKEMVKLVPGSVDATVERHVPVFKRIDDCTVKVEVGSAPHPMSKEHHIVFIYLQTKNGGQFRRLDPEKPAVAEFCECKDKVIAVYAYCNIHGLWMASVDEPSKKSSCQCCVKDNK